MKIPAALSVFAVFSAVGSAADDATDFFEKRVRPVFAEHCYECHSAEAKKIKGGLRLDSREAIMKGGESGAAIVAGKPEQSRLIEAVRHADKDLQMPPPKDGALRKLSEAAIADMAQWIRTGAAMPESAPLAKQNSQSSNMPHWAFLAPKMPALPAVKGESWVKTDIDRFILAKLEAAGLEPAPPADPRTLIRRLSYDLTGLPPTPQEVESFAADCSRRPDEAHAALVERLLSTAAYGEKWGRRWLDVVRYADSAGDNSDYPSPLAWRFRNYVIDAFNRDKPYDQFVREQIAGDILVNTLLRDGANVPPARYAECVTATGFLAIARRFGGSKDDRDFYLTAEDTIDTIGKSVLGLSIGCARCHNHKYDPITVRDYYGLYGIFASTRFPHAGNEEAQRPRDLVPLVPPQFIAETLKPWETEQVRLDAGVQGAESALAEKQKAFAASAPSVLAQGDVPNGGNTELNVAEAVTLSAGDVLQLAILPKTNHGADSTQVELEIADEAGHTWSVAEVVRDFANDTGGTRWGAWSLFGVEPAGGLFTRFERDVVNTKGLHHWQGAADFPVVTAHTADTPVKILNAVFAPRSLVLHPAPAGGVAVAWESPGGTFRVKGRVVDIDPVGGDGVAWKLERRPALGAVLADSSSAAQSLAAARKLRGAHLAEKPAIEMGFAVAERDAPADARIQRRGEPKDLGDEVPRKNLALLGGEPVPADSGSGRAALAEWLVSPRNPLTARVMVNRIWQGHFGRGLVATPNDFGTRGAPPSHPELLDWLAQRFIESGWSVKAMHRLMLSSAVYRQATDRRQPAADALSHFPSRRLDAEELRDTLLALTGELDSAPGAGHPFPPENTWGFTQHNPFKAVYDSNKRSVYLMTQRIQRHPFLALFDGADTSASTPTRSASTVPTQALWFLNNPFVHARAEAFARRLLALPGDTQRLALAYRLCFQRLPTDRESQSASAFLAAYRDEGATPEAAWTTYARVLFSSNELVFLE